MNNICVTPDDDLQKILDGLTAPATIYLKKGVYRQKIKITKDNVKLVGEECETTVITYDDYARKIHADGQEYNTFRTYTVCVTGENVQMSNFTIENAAGNPKAKGQSVALSVNAKRFSAAGMSLVSTQDTLFLAPFPDDLVVRYRNFLPVDELYMEGAGTHIFKNCKISGTVDFIFGCAEAYFDGCEIISLDDGRDFTYIAAPAHSLKQKHGFAFCGCNIVSGGAKEASVYLARPWRDFGKCDFINCTAGAHINRLVFDKWNDTERDKTARFACGNVTFAGEVTPVTWSKQLTAAQVRAVLKRLDKVRALYNLE